jgi:ATP-dependent Clp protease ATP-binding subunit ClpB
MKTATGQKAFLDPDLRSEKVVEFEEALQSVVIGQERAVHRMVNVYQIYLASMNAPGRPVSTMLFLGPTGSGKTRVVEASAEILFGHAQAFVKIDCAEFQHSHEIAKLIGSPPGYLGHRETPPLLTQEALDQYHTEDLGLNFVLFDEIEKASDALWQLLLGVLDEGTDPRYGARHLKRAIERFIVFPLSNLIATSQIELGDLVTVDVKSESRKVEFIRERPNRPRRTHSATG